MCKAFFYPLLILGSTERRRAGGAVVGASPDDFQGEARSTACSGPFYPANCAGLLAAGHFTPLARLYSVRSGQRPRSTAPGPEAVRGPRPSSATRRLLVLAERDQHHQKARPGAARPPEQTQPPRPFPWKGSFPPPAPKGVAGKAQGRKKARLRRFPAVQGEKASERCQT